MNRIRLKIYNNQLINIVWNYIYHFVIYKVSSIIKHFDSTKLYATHTSFYVKHLFYKCSNRINGQIEIEYIGNK